MKCTLARRHVGTLLLCLAVVPTCRLVSQDTVPVGYGTLRRDDIAVRLATGTIEVQVLPLDEQVIRLLAPDTYRSLTQLVQSRATRSEERRVGKEWRYRLSPEQAEDGIRDGHVTGVQTCALPILQTCIAGYRSGGLWNAAPRRHRRTSGNRHDRGSGAAARRAGDPPARAGHVSLPHAARAEPSNGSRRCCRPRIYAESDSGNGHAPRCRAAGAIQSGRFDHHEPRPPVSPHRDRAALADLELISTERATAGSRDLPIRAGYQRSRTADRQLSGPVQRRLEPLAASARSG